MNTKQLTTALMAIILLGGTIVFADDFIDKMDKTYDTMYSIDRTVTMTDRALNTIGNILRLPNSKKTSYTPTTTKTKTQKSKTKTNSYYQNVYNAEEVQKLGNSSYYKIKRKGKWAIFNKKTGAQICNFVYDEIDTSNTKGFYKITKNGKKGMFYIAQSTNSYVSTGVAVPTDYDDVEPTKALNYFLVSKNGYWGVYNAAQKELTIQIKYTKDRILHSRDLANFKED